MSTRKERFTKYLETTDNYIKHQMSNHTDGEKEAFRQKQIAMYDDEIERHAEKLCRALETK